jgi:hypothetical protein
MDLFAITCTTCRSRLRVRDPAAVGQILACPRCGGMVMVKPPPAWQEAGEQKSELPTAADAEGPRVKFDETVHNSAFDVLEDLLSDAPPKVQTPPTPRAGAVKKASNTPPSGSSSGVIPPPAGKPRFVGGPPVKRSATPPPVPAKASGAPGSAGPSDAGPIPPVVRNGGSSPAPPVTPKEKNAQAGAKENNGKEKSAAAKSPPAPPPMEASAGAAPSATVAARRAQWLAVGSIALGVVLAFAAVTAAIHFLRPADVRRPIVPKKNGKAQNAEVATKSKSEVQSTEEEKSFDGAISAALPGGNSESPVVAAAGNATNDATPQSPGAAATTDPLGLVKETPPAASSPTGTTAAVTSDPLAKFDRFLDGGTNDPLNKPPARAAATPEPPPAADSAPARPLAPRPPPRVVDVGKQLAFSLGAMETAGTPLAEFVQLMSEVSAIPITLDVPFIPATPLSPVALRLTNTTVGNALAEALKPLRLEYVVENDQLVVRRAEGKLPASSTVSVKDLTGGDEPAMRELVELLKAVVDPAAWAEGDQSGTISVDAAKGSLVITHPRSVRYPIGVRMAIEKLREARTPPLAHELKVDAALFKLDTRSTLAKPRLDKAISLNYSQPTRLITISERLGNAAGVRILVDWRDVASAGWNPSGEATLTARNEPLSAALDALLTPLDLTWRVIDGQTIQVVTPARLAEQGELEFYKIDDLLSGGRTPEELIGQLCVALGEGVVMAGGEPSSAGGVIGYDDGGKCLLAWLSQVKQRELEGLLTKWRAEKAK